MSRAAFEAVCLSTPLLKADAIVILTGDGLTRVPAAIELFRQMAAPIIVVSGGVDAPPYAVPAPKLIGQLIAKGIAPDRLRCEDESQHTRDSAERIVQWMLEEGWHRVMLVTSPYHVPRSLLSFIAVLNERDMADRYHVLTASSYGAWFEEAEPGTRRIDLVEREATKVAVYQEKGDVATYEDGLAYLEYWEANL